jgi:hypothetical protein
MRQAQKLPAYLHPENGLAPAPAEGKGFIPAGMAFVDPSDGSAYYSNGAGFFEGINLKCVREHPGHTLLPIREENCELGYGHLNRLLNDARDAVAAAELGKKVEEEIDMRWIQQRLDARHVNYVRNKVPGSTDKHPFYVMAVLFGYTKEMDDAIRLDIADWIKKRQEKRDLDKQTRKDDREWMRTAADREMQAKMQEEKQAKLKARYQEIYQIAIDAGISNDRFAALFKQTADPGKEVELTEESLALLEQFISNEIDVQQAKQEMAPAPAKELSPAAAPAAKTEALETAATEMAAERQAAAPQDPVAETAVPESAQQPEKEAEEAQVIPETYVDEDGCVRYKESGDYVDLPIDRVSSILEDAPEGIEETAPQKFTINTEDAACWYVRKIRRNQRTLEQAKAELKEAQNAVKTIESRTSSDNAGLRYTLGASFITFLKGLLTNSKGVMRKKSHVFGIDGVAKLVETGGLFCYDQAKFKAWWAEMQTPEKDAERAMYEHKTSFTMSETQIEANIRAELEIPGYSLRPVVENGDFQVTAPTAPRKSKAKAGEPADSNDEAEDDEDAA